MEVKHQLKVYNTLKKEKVDFQAINPPFVGMYVCGPTVYGDPHLGHARPYITFDIVFRYLKYLGFKVRYVRNITDVGHLVNDADAGEDKIAKKAKLDQLEPMEVVQQYTLSFRKAMQDLNTLPPSIEPTASGHIIEQMEMVQEILNNGYAYESNGSIYFDVKKYNETHNYGALSGRNVEDMIDGSRDLDGQSDKKNGVDFALWKKADPEHIMRWNSVWSEGFPGWHLECSAMSRKYLGNHFDIHGGGMDLKFPHHECEIAQSIASFGQEPAKYWMHNNMITINGQKMGKSLNNPINLSQIFSGEHEFLEQAYSPMTVRFFILSAQYRSTLEFSNKALQDAEKGLARLLNALQTLDSLHYTKDTLSQEEEERINNICAACSHHMNDDFDTTQTLARLFELASEVNSYHHGHKKIGVISETTFNRLKEVMHLFIKDILGLKEDDEGGTDKLDGVMELLIDIRKDARTNKDFATSDKIRDVLKKLEIQLKDEKDGKTLWVSA